MGEPPSVPVPMGAVAAVSDIAQLEPLDDYRRELLDLTARRLADGHDPLEITSLIAAANTALTRRLLLLGETRLGPPPCRYAWLVLGSQGRGEQVLSSDQDHAIAYRDPVPAEAVAVHAYLGELAELVVTGLERAGLPRCSGGYMATRWCRPFGEFRDLFHGWVDEPEPQALLQAEVFLDFQACHGDLPVGELERLLLTGGGRAAFRVQMARAAVAFRPPLTVLGRLATTHSELDLKRGGTAAIVLLARLHALAAGSSARSTVDRLGAKEGALSPLDAADLTDAYRFLTGLRLHRQVARAAAGEPLDNHLRPEDLTGAERKRLRTALHVVRDVQEVTARRFATQTVT
ncbi:MAG: putative nucleotidyltransferase substrate binding domain-containing protein [Cellulomonas sp.]